MTTATLPEALQGKYEIVKPITGGPVFALPHLGISSIDFSKLTEKEAENLVRKGWKGIRRVEAPPQPSPQGEGAQPLEPSVLDTLATSLEEKPANTAEEQVPGAPVQGRNKRQ